MRHYLIALLILLLGGSPTWSQKGLTENQKIDSLIAYVKNSKHITFIRNGDEHAAKDAAKHLKRKRDWLEDDIQTAREFIEKAATKSSFSGKYYTVRLKSGKIVRNAHFLLEKLKQLETQ